MIRRSGTAVFAVLILLALAVPFITHAQLSLDSLRPGEWYQIPGSRLDQSGVFPPSGAPLGNGADSVMAAWSGGAYDTQRDRLIIWGGGHNDYGGNELYAFTLSTQRWTRIWGPSSGIPSVGASSCPETVGGGDPNSRHTYDGVVYVAPLDKLFGSGGSLWCGSGGGSRKGWFFNFSTNRWEDKGSNAANGVSQVSDYDPASQSVFVESDQGLFAQFNTQTGAWTNRGSQGASGEEQVGVIDPDRRLMIVFGNGNLHVWNLQTFQRTTPSTSGGSAVIGARGPAAAWDPTLKRVVAWVGGTTVYSLDPGTWQWQQHQAASTNTVTPPDPTRVGMFGRWQYVPSKNLFIVVTGVDQNVFAYKLSAGTGTPPPPPAADTTAPTVSLTAPANGTTVSGSSITLSATATDNVGVLGVQFKVDGVNVGAEDTAAPYSMTWNTGTIAAGSHTITAVARDAAGNTNTASVTVTVPNATDTTLPAVSITAPSGGTVSGTSVTLSATASDNVGVVGVQFKIDGVNVGAEDTTAPYSIAWNTTQTSNGNHTLTAVARDLAGNTRTSTGITVTVSNDAPAPPPPPSSGLSLASRTWVSRPLPGFPASYGGGKHTRLLFDSKRGRLAMAGGDYDTGREFQDGNQYVWALDVVTSTWTIIGPWCMPPGSTQPGRPDSVGWVYDSTRDQGIVLPGFYFITQNMGSGCPGVTESAGSMLFDFATNSWKSPAYPAPAGGYGGDNGSSFAVYDPTTDSVYRMRWEGSNVMEILSLATNSWGRVTLDSSDMNRKQSAIDVQGRNIYVISSRLNALLRYSIPDRRIVETIPMPSQWTPPGGSDMESYLVFDPINRVLLNPVTHDFYGQVYGLAIYHVDTKQWEWEAVPSNVSGNMLGFDVANNAMVLSGRSTTGVYWLYRYAGGSGTPPPPPPTDTTAPTVSMTSPATAATVSGASVSVSATASDNVGVVGVQFKVDGVNLGPEDTSSSYSTTWDTRTVSNGSHTITAVARDAAGNTTTTSVTVTVTNTSDTTAPTVSITAPAASATVSGASVPLSATATDTVGVVGVQFKVNGVNVGAEDTTAPYSAVWNSTTVANGSHTIAAVARDAAGNTTTASMTITVTNTSDTAAPTVSITAPAASATVSGPVTLSATASDNVGVAGVQFKVDGVNAYVEDTTSPYSGAWDSTSVANGSHVITAVARDAAGNITTSAPVTVNVSNAISSQCAGGRTLQGAPNNYLSLVSSLQPCDTLVLAAGTYNANGLPVDNRNGTATQPITITGPASGPAAVIFGLSGQNTVRIRNSSYVVIKNLEIDGRNLGVDPVNNEAPSHHITLENLYIHGCSDDQGTVGISTNRAPAWNWIIRRNVITDCGTGLYLGNSDGNEQFLAGLIEYNFVYDTIGYNMEIKHQNALPTSVPGLPLTTTKTIVRYNVFSKANNASGGSMARPNFLVGHVPLSGPGQDNYYEIYGNFLYQNPSGEPLFQGEGNYAFYDNLLFNSVDPSGAYHCLLAQPHNDRPRSIRIFNNTVVCRQGGISISGGYSTFSQKVIGNAVFAASPISAADQQGNITDSYQNAVNSLNNPFAPLGSFDLFPKVGRLTGTTLDMNSVNNYGDWDRDFNGTQRTDFRFRGAYAGEGTNPGWLPRLERRPTVGSAPAPPSDTAPPTVAITSPETGATLSGVVTLSATASDNVGVVGVQFKVDGVNAYAEDTTSPYSGTWDSTNVANGTHVISAIARDAAGNTSSTSITIVVSNQTQAPDSTPPTVAVTSPALGATVSGGTITLSATASDNLGVMGVRFKVDGVNVGAEDTTAPYSMTWNSTTVTNGARTISAVARDAAGNTTTSSVTVTVANATADTTPPSAAITAPSSGATILGTSVTLSATASDNLGVVGVQFKVDGVNVGAEDTTAPYSMMWNSTTVANGSHTITAVARDAAGNTNPTTSMTFFVSNPTSSPNPTPSHTTTVDATDDWCGIVNAAVPGEEVVFGPGNYSDPCSITAVGTAAAPIVIRSFSEESSQRATFTYSGPSVNVLELRDAAFLVIRGFAFSPTQADVDAIRIRRANDVVIERNNFQGIGGVSINASDNSTQRITVRDNEFKDLKSTGIYFGCHDGLACSAVEFAIERNLIDGVTTPFNPAYIGYGIQAKLNSYGTIRANTIYRTKGPGVMVYGSNRNDPPSIVEGNWIEGSSTEGGIVVGGGPAVVRNNVLIGNAFGGVSAQNYGGRNLQRNVWIVHNTLLNNDHSGINVEAWASGNGNVIAYNAIAPKSGTPALNPSSPAGTIVGNITCGASSGCFVHSTSTPYNLLPAIGGPLVDAAGGGSESWRPSVDFAGLPRGATAEVGAFEQGLSGPVADTTPPSVTITAPSSGATVSGSSITLSATASDNSGVAAVQFLVDGVNVASEDTTNDYTATWDSRAVPDGQHLLTAVARDSAGNTSSTSVTLIVANADTTQPTVAITAPAAGGTVSGASVTLSATASDNVGVVGVQFKVDGVNVGAEDTTAPYSVAWNSMAVANGSRTITAVARDAAGNTKTFSVTVTVKNADTTQPTVAITAPTAGGTVSGASVTLSATASDNVGVVGVQFKVDGVNVGAEDTTAPYSVAWNSMAVANGSRTITAVARDAAGNTKTSAPVTITASNSLPTPPPSTTSGSSVRVWKMSSNGGTGQASRLLAFDPALTGVVSVATGDVDGDGVAEVITGAGNDGNTSVRIWRVNAQGTVSEVASFFAYDPALSISVYVAAGDIDGDGKAEIITGAGGNGSPHVRVWKVSAGGTISEVASFYAYDPANRNGVAVAAGDVDGDGKAEIITGAGPDGGSHVRVWKIGAGGVISELAGFSAYGTSASRRVFVAAGDIDGDGKAEIITGYNGRPRVRVWKVGAGGAISRVASFYAYDSAYQGGVSVAAGDVDGDGKAEIITGPGPNGSSRIRVWKVGVGYAVSEVTSFSAYESSYNRRVYVGAGQVAGDGSAEVVTGTATTSP